MPLTVLDPEKAQFLALDAGAFDALVKEWGWPVFRAQQVRDWVYSKLIDSPAAMSNIGMADRAILQQRIVVINSRIVSQQTSSDGTVKLLLQWPDVSQAETVMIPDGERRTACV